MPLTDLNFGKCTASNITTHNLQFCCQLVLCEFTPFPKYTNVFSHLFFVLYVHNITICT